MIIKNALLTWVSALMWLGVACVCFAEPVRQGQMANGEAVQSTVTDPLTMDHSRHMSRAGRGAQTPMDHSGHGNMTDHSQHQGMGVEMDHSMHAGHADHNMTLDAEGMVMNSNEAQLPEDCSEISREYAITVRAGTAYAKPFAGSIFGMDKHEVRVEPCSRIVVTFINEDEIRHQWMVHKLPKYIYPQGMFHLEAAGGATKTGSLIVPSDDRTYLIHCDIAQHMEKGMKAQLVVGSGGGDLPSIPGITQAWRPDIYAFGLGDWAAWALAFVSGIAVMILGRKVLL